MTDDWFDPDEPIILPVEDSIDLHTFLPRDVPDLLTEYFQACREKGIMEVRVIHGKGTGQLRHRVEKFLDKSPVVLEYCAAPPERGGWGATVVRLK